MLHSMIRASYGDTNLGNTWQYHYNNFNDMINSNFINFNDSFHSNNRNKSKNAETLLISCYSPYDSWL